MLSNRLPERPLQDVGADVEALLAEFERLGGDARVAADILADLARPSRITTPNGPTCSSTCAQVKLALIDPYRYARLLTDLAGGKDHPLASGVVVRAHYGLRAGAQGSTTDQLFQDNLQHFAATATSLGKPVQRLVKFLDRGPLGRLFDTWRGPLEQFLLMETDRYDPLSPFKWGHCLFQMEYLHRHLFGETAPSSWLDSHPAAMWAALQGELRRGRPVAVSLLDLARPDVVNTFHVVTVLGSDSRETVRFHTWGGERQLSREDFQACCVLVLAQAQSC